MHMCMQLKAVALEASFDEDVRFACHLLRESGINVDEGNIEVSSAFVVFLLITYFIHSLMEQPFYGLASMVRP